MKKYITLPASNILLLICLIFAHFLSAQTCSCNIAQVESNTVSSCEITIGDVVIVSTTSEFRSAITTANQTGGNMTILIEDGTYAVASTDSYPYITASNMVIRSASGNRDNVVLTGQGMQSVAPETEIVLYLVGDNITVSDLTIRDCGNHGIAMNSSNHLIHNVRMQNTFEQMVKGNGDVNANTVIQCSLFEYTAGVGPQWYIGGLDIHGAQNIEVRDNVFRNINSPSQAVAEHAVHFWDNAANNLVERNKIVNCDRGIGFGLGSSANVGGIIRNNTIVNEGNTPYHDVGIGLESSPGTEVYNNSVMVAYPNAIEYRFQSTTDVIITNNLTNRAIQSRNGGTATLSTNVTNAELTWFTDPVNGDLHLASNIATVVDQGTSVPSVIDDIDQEARPFNGTYDIGADEYAQLLDADMDGYTSDIDCDDDNDEVNPGMEEIIYNGIDDDCDPTTLDDDQDEDGFLLADDCNDMDAAVNPDMEEIPYNDTDDDCDASTPDDDIDGDGFLLSDDCNDDNAQINPGMEEVPYNGIDDDCNENTVDDDLDGDGFLLADDCDDDNAEINPDAEEIYDNDVDEDCDGFALMTATNDHTDVQITVYPNPVSDKLNIEMTGDVKFVLKLYSTDGKLVLVDGNTDQLNLENLNSGIYFLHILSSENGKGITERVVVLR